MKENRNYYPMGKTVKRIIRVFGENGDSLSTNEIYVLLLNQKSIKTGRLYKTNPSKGSLAQILSKYPYFSKTGYIDESTIQGPRMRITTWKLNEVKEK
tara:strand:- start:8961 stop:9254 length:294 start_codon:yes stop_codon:yes gene_type:complete